MFNVIFPDVLISSTITTSWAFGAQSEVQTPKKWFAVKSTKYFPEVR